jgi:hypothetical protein
MIVEPKFQPSLFSLFSKLNGSYADKFEIFIGWLYNCLMVQKEKKVDVVGLRWLQDLYYSDVPNLLPFFEKCF